MKTFRVAFVAAILSGGLAAPAFAEWSKLLTPAELQALAAERAIEIVDIRSADGGADGKAPNYMAGHIAGSVNAPYDIWRGPKQNPGEKLTDAQLDALLSSTGLEPGEPVVIVYEGPSPVEFGAAARVYWNLKSAGFGEIAILNGGLAEWRAAGLPLVTGTPAPVAVPVDATLSDEWFVTREEVLAVVEGKADAILLDARAPAQWKGAEKHGAAKVPGTLPGAYNAPFTTFFDKDKTALFSVETTKKWAEAAAQDIEGKPVITFCNTGQLGATDWFALSEIAGLANVKLYPESLADWTHADLPVTFGQ